MTYLSYLTKKLKYAQKLIYYVLLSLANFNPLSVYGAATTDAAAGAAGAGAPRAASFRSFSSYSQEEFKELFSLAAYAYKIYKDTDLIPSEGIPSEKIEESKRYVSDALVELPVGWTKEARIIAETGASRSWRRPNIKSSTFGLVALKREDGERPGKIAVVYRGTQTQWDWATNQKFWQQRFNDRDDRLVHKGFNKAEKSAMAILPTGGGEKILLQELIHTLVTENPSYEIIFLGHSLGGALAGLSAARFFDEHAARRARAAAGGAGSSVASPDGSAHIDDRSPFLQNRVKFLGISSPRVGNTAFRDRLHSLLHHTEENVNCLRAYVRGDIVPRVLDPHLIAAARAILWKMRRRTYYIHHGKGVTLSLAVLARKRDMIDNLLFHSLIIAAHSLSHLVEHAPESLHRILRTLPPPSPVPVGRLSTPLECLWDGKKIRLEADNSSDGKIKGLMDNRFSTMGELHTLSRREQLKIHLWNPTKRLTSAGAVDASIKDVELYHTIDACEGAALRTVIHLIHIGDGHYRILKVMGE